MKKLVMAAVIPVLALGCGEEAVDANGDGIADGVKTPDNVSVVVPAEPKGTVSGQVLTTQQKPLANVTVAMTIGSDIGTTTTTTDASGNFAFREIPGGAQVLLTFSAPGYAPLRAVSRVPTEAGNIPINDGNASFGPVLLAETSGTVRFTLISPTGRPAEGVKATLEVDGAGTVLFGPTDQVSSTVVAEAIADAQGVVTFDNVPPPAEIDRITTSASAYKLVVAAHDANGDGVLESNGLVRSYSGSDLITGANARPLALNYTYRPDQGLSIDHSNLATLKGGSTLPQFNMLKPNESIYIVFNQPVQTNSVIVGLTDEYGKENLPIDKAVSNGGVVLTLKPQGALQPGREYNLYYRAVSLNGGTVSSNTISFFGGDLSSPQPISIESMKFQEQGTTNGVIDSSISTGFGEDVYVNFNQVMHVRLGSQAAFVYIGADLNNSGKIGDAAGERDPATGKTVGLNSGYPLVQDEPTAPIATKIPAERPVFPFRLSGYTTRFRFRYTGNYFNGTSTVAYTSLNPTSNFPIFIHFSALSPTTDAYESSWGVAQVADITHPGATVTPLGVPVSAQ
jgi:hypothetical protein